MIAKILEGLAAVVVVLAVVVALRPSHFHIERKIGISAPAAVPFARVNDLRRWQDFSPWAKLDPAAKVVFEGPSAGVGASSTWAGNREVGEGRMTIVESRPNELVRFRLEFKKPMKAVNTAEFTFKPEGGGVTVAWSMSGENNFVGKAVGLFINCDKMVGAQFEQGLASLKTLSEAR